MLRDSATASEAVAEISRRPSVLSKAISWSKALKIWRLICGDAFRSCLVRSGSCSSRFGVAAFAPPRR